MGRALRRATAVAGAAGTAAAFAEESDAGRGARAVLAGGRR